MPHAPFEAAELEAAGITHAFLGHFHAPRDAERYTYPGNPDPLDFGETGERGAVLAVVGADGSVTRERRIVATSVVHDLVLTVDGARHGDDVRAQLEAALAPLTGCVRVTLTGELAAEAEVGPATWAGVGAHLDDLVVRDGGLARSPTTSIGWPPSPRCVASSCDWRRTTSRTPSCAARW